MYKFTHGLMTSVDVGRYERSFSPPRSSNSSGYGTGSSSKSFSGTDPRFSSNPEVRDRFIITTTCKPLILLANQI